MRIAIWHNLGAGGAKRHLYQHVKGLLEKGHHIESWCPSTANQDFLPLSDLIKEHLLPFNCKCSAIWPWEKWLHVWRYHTSLLNAMDRLCYQCSERIREGKFDVVFVTNCQLTTVAPMGRYLKTPSILYLHEPCRLLYEAILDAWWIERREAGDKGRLRGYLHDGLRLMANRRYMTCERTNASLYNLILVNSFFSRESVLRAYGLDSEVHYTGVDLTCWTDRRMKRQPYVLGVGSLSPHKNIPFIIEAIGLIPLSKRPSLIWIGAGGSRQWISDVKQLALSSKVDFQIQEHAADEHLIDIYNEAAALIFAPCLEPFGLGPLEANACGLPVIATAEGGMRETVKDGINGILVSPTKKALAEGIQRVLDDPGLARRLSESGQQHVASCWNLKDSIVRIENWLQRVAEGEYQGVARPSGQYR